MIHRIPFLHKLCGRDTYEALVHTLYNQSKGFPEAYQKYTEAIEQLRQELGNETTPSVDMFVTAIEMQCSSNMLFAGFQGLKMNYDHFMNPMMPNITWKQIDFEDAWREELASDLPMYYAAQRVIDDFYHLLTVDQKDRLYDPINEYESYLHVSAPKLAHYYGYAMGNTLLRLIVPSYHDDPTLDLRYHSLLKECFGCSLDLSQWNGEFNLKVWKSAPIAETNDQSDIVLREQVYNYPHKLWLEQEAARKAKKSDVGKSKEITE